MSQEWFPLKNVGDVEKPLNPRAFSTNAKIRELAMTIRALPYAFALSTVLLACAPAEIKPGDGRNHLPCPGASCDVQVSVVSCFVMFNCLMVDWDVVDVPRGNSPNIRWRLVTAGYTFTVQGIDGLPNPPFSCRRDGDGRQFMCMDDNRQGSSAPPWKYTINVSGPHWVHSLDPWVVNN